jgi:hypothetical protein
MADDAGGRHTGGRLVLPEQKKNTNIYVGLGLIGQILGKSMLEGSSPGLGALITLGACVMFIWGCCEYALGKGHSRWWGGLGLLSILGLIVLVFLPDRHKDAVS